MTYRESIDWLFSTQWFGIKLGLEGPKHLLEENGCLDLTGTTVIHVAGTNGKGSTCAMIDRLGRAAGKRSGLFTSPHLIDFRERIQVDGVQITEAACAAGLTKLRAWCEQQEHHPTFFEIALALALDWFRQQQCDWIVLETGMGGRLDATTAVPADVCVITPIGMDHTQFLGDTLEAIAAEKAGIIVPNKPLVVAPQPAEARDVIAQIAADLNAELTWVDGEIPQEEIALAGPHQRRNAALAVVAARAAGVELAHDELSEALKGTSWPGRFERFTLGGKTIILDGAHNPHSAEVLAQTWREQFGEVKPTLLFSAVAAKDIAGILHHLVPIATRIVLCAVDTPRAVPAAELALELPADAPPHETCATFADAIARARQYPEAILIAGSLFLVGEARALLTGGRFQSSCQ